MNSYIYDAVIYIERRTQEILDDLRALREQIFYAYDSNDNEDQQEEREADRQEAFEYLVTNEK